MPIKEKEIKVSYRSVPKPKHNYFYGGESYYPPHSQIQLQGKWLEEAGFHIGDKVKVFYEDNRIILEPISPDNK